MRCVRCVWRLTVRCVETDGEVRVETDDEVY